MTWVQVGHVTRILNDGHSNASNAAPASTLRDGHPTLQKLGASHLCVRIVIDEFLAYHCRRRVANGARGLDGKAERYADLALQE